jgi:hypothetical protein
MKKTVKTIGQEAVEKGFYSQKELKAYYKVQAADRRISRQRKANLGKKLSTIVKVDKKAR